MFCTWERSEAAPGKWHRYAQRALLHRERSLNLLRIVNHVLAAASAAWLTCIFALLTD